MNTQYSKDDDQLWTASQLLFLYDDLGGELKSMIRAKVSRLIGNYNFVPADFDDLLQEVTTDLLRRLEYFDPSRGAVLTFASRVIDNRIATLIERQRSSARSTQGNTVSVDELPEEQCDDEVIKRHLAHLDAEDLKIDLQKALLALPRALSSVCLMMHDFVSMGEPPAACLSRKAYKAALQNLRRELRQTGLCEYL